MSASRETVSPSASRKGTAPPEQDYREKVTLDEIPQDGQDLLVNYAHVPRERLVNHVCSIRDEAYKLTPYPCVGQVRFLNNRWKTMPYFDDFLTRLRAGANLIELGCCFAQEIRFLHHTYSIPASQLYALDLEPGLIDLGFKLFQDRSAFNATFLTADLLHIDGSVAWSALRGKMDLVLASQVFHVWDLDDQFRAAVNVVSLTRGVGSVIAGNQVGSSVPGTYKIRLSDWPDNVQYRHNEESFKQFWDDVGDATETKWDVRFGVTYSKAVEEHKATAGRWGEDDKGLTMFWFSVTRLE